MTQDEKNIVALSRAYSTMVARCIGREYPALAIRNPRGDKNWRYFESFYCMLKYKGIWDEHEIFLAAQFDSLPSKFRFPYPNMLYGYTAWSKYDAYKAKRKRRIPESDYKSVRAVGYKEIFLAFKQSAYNFRKYRSFGFSNFEMYKLFPDQFTVYFIAVDPDVRLRLSGDSDTDRFSPAVKKFYKRLCNMRSLRGKLDALWQELVTNQGANTGQRGSNV